MAKTSNKYTFMDLILEVLREENRPLTAREIWEIANRTGRTSKLGSQGKTPIDTVGATIYWDIKYNDETLFKKVSTWPTKFGLKDIVYSESERDDDKQGPDKCLFNERDLHRLLSSYVYRNEGFACQTKTIMHEKSKKEKQGTTEWLHPDIVGVHFPDGDYSSEVVELQDKLGCKNYKIYSFEMKKDLGFSNIRQCYFQAVSNSSWANEGYLVALEIDDDEEFIRELKRLNNAFGIGIIKLNADNISQSKVVFPSKVSQELDWETIDLLAEKNPDFNIFVKEIALNKQRNNRASIFDEVCETDDSCREYAVSKHIITEIDLASE